MTDKTIRRVALAFIAVAAMACGVLGARFHSIAWSVIAAWLLFTLVVETWPRS